MINLKFLAKAVEITDGNEFRVLYLIANTLGMKNTTRCRIYRDQLSDKLNIDPRTITRITNKLVGKGLIKKDLVSENGKKKDYYSLNLDIIGTEGDDNLDSVVSIKALNKDGNVPFNKINKINNTKKTNNSNKEEGVKDESLLLLASGQDEEKDVELPESNHSSSIVSLLPF